MATPEKNVHLPKFFDKYPEIKGKLVEYLSTLSDDEKKKSLEQYRKYIAGEMTWGEIRGITKRMQRELARYAHLKFKMKDFKEAEKMYKGLAIIDHTNWYYRAALGAVYQKQRKYDDAIDEYDISIALKDDEMSNYVNRGECLMMIKDFSGARKDFDTVTTRDLPKNNSWMVRAMAFQARLTILEKQEQDGQ